MTIAEKRANEYYPKLNEQDDVAAWHGFIAGYEQAKKDMMKEAVEGGVTTNGFYPYEPCIVASYPNCPYAIGDNVRIVVLKAEE